MLTLKPLQALLDCVLLPGSQDVVFDAKSLTRGQDH